MDLPTAPESLGHTNGGPPPVNEPKQNTALVVGAISILIGMGIGILGTTALGSARTTTETNATANVTPANQNVSQLNPAAVATDTKAADFRVLLNTLYRDHISLLSNAVRRNFQSDPEFQAAYTSLNQNASSLAAAIGSIYGPDAERRFVDVWTRQNEAMINYADAVKAGKSEDKTNAANALNAVTYDTAKLYSELSPNLPLDGVQSLITAEVVALRESVDAFATKDYTTAYVKEQEAANQTTNIANTLSNSIVKQYPEKF